MKCYIIVSTLLMFVPIPGLSAAALWNATIEFHARNRSVYAEGGFGFIRQRIEIVMRFLEHTSGHTSGQENLNSEAPR